MTHLQIVSTTKQDLIALHVLQDTQELEYQAVMVFYHSYLLHINSHTIKISTNATKKLTIAALIHPVVTLLGHFIVFARRDMKDYNALTWMNAKPPIFAKDTALIQSVLSSAIHVVKALNTLTHNA